MPLEQVAESEIFCPVHIEVAVVTPVGGGITILLVVVFEFTVEKLLPETEAVFVIAQLVGELLMVALKVMVVLFPAGRVNPEPEPATVTVSPAKVSVIEF